MVYQRGTKFHYRFLKDGKSYYGPCPDCEVPDGARFLYSDNTIDGQSMKKAYALFESGMLANLEPGGIKCLQQIHGLA